MARLQPMPPVALPTAELAELGKLWDAAAVTLPKAQGEQVGSLCDRAVGKALATMLGVMVEKPLSNLALLPPKPDCVEVGPTRVIGGIRPQNFDVAYRPDGVRFAYDSKTLNSRGSLGKESRLATVVLLSRVQARWMITSDADSASPATRTTLPS